MAEYQIKFMFADATTMDESFDAGVTVLDAKQRMIANWPEGKEPVTGPEDLKLIHGGKVLDSEKSFEELKVLKGTQVIMHCQPRPPQQVKEEKVMTLPPPGQLGDQSRCCTIL
mmetsp:Transcript_43543/g.102313  ORF Transcript_43543/g.102313 Transcript_43543/m.102313 type:complete len:113 (-) Transcript_43543:93-431(-)